MKGFVPLCDLHSILASQCRAEEPDGGNRIQLRLVYFDCAFTQAVHSGGFKHLAQVLKLFELVKVKRQDAPATPEHDLDKTFLL